jgi:hypothetical protein
MSGHSHGPVTRSLYSSLLDWTMSMLNVTLWALVSLACIAAVVLAGSRFGSSRTPADHADPVASVNPANRRLYDL